MFKETVRKQNKVELCVGGHRSRPRKFSTQSYFATLTLGLQEPEKDQISAKASTYLFNYDKHRLRLRKKYACNQFHIIILFEFLLKHMTRILRTV